MTPVSRVSVNLGEIGQFFANLFERSAGSWVRIAHLWCIIELSVRSWHIPRSTNTFLASSVPVLSYFDNLSIQRRNWPTVECDYLL